MKYNTTRTKQKRISRNTIPNLREGGGGSAGGEARTRGDGGGREREITTTCPLVCKGKGVNTRGRDALTIRAAVFYTGGGRRGGDDCILSPLLGRNHRGSRFTTAFFLRGYLYFSLGASLCADAASKTLSQPSRCPSRLHPWNGRPGTQLDHMCDIQQL
jgi:hypothetical protein